MDEGAILAPTAQGNPQVIAGPISWAAEVIADRVVLSSATFATATAYWPECSRARMSHRRSQPVATPAESTTG
ncbi:MAG: hypothetical protein ACRDQ1_05960 [Sciscionella sp.]